jgi:hypothetical protein
MFTPQPPDLLVQYSQPLARLFVSLLSHPNMYAVLLYTVVYIVLIGGLFSVVYAYMYRMAAPSRYGPMDAPPPKTKIKKYKR